MITGSTVNLILRRQTAAGAPSTGKVLADFALAFYLDGVSQAITPTITELTTVGTSRLYRLTFDAPASTGKLAVVADVASGTDVVWMGEPEDVAQYSVDSLAALVAAPVVSVVSAGAPANDVALRVVKGDYAPVSLTVRDQAGNALNLSGYTNAIFCVLDRAQGATRYTQTTSITLGTGGAAAIAIPESASFYSLLTTGNDSITLYFTLKADEAGDAAKTRTLARGTITVLRTETP